jgi:DNA-binding transcriptional LysR family regulator
MEFHQLRYFIAAAEDSSMTRAAARLHVSQPALSRQIALLEKELGVALFDRIKKRIHLTDAGRHFLTKSRQIICDAELLVQHTREQFGKARKTLRLGLLTPLIDDLVAPVVREFRLRYPKAKISLFELAPRAQLDRLRSRELDAAIVGNIDESDRRSFSTRRLARHRMAAVLPESHALARAKSVELGALRGESWVSLSDVLYPGRRAFLREVCLAAGFEPDIGAEVDSLTLVLAAVGADEGVAILPAHCRKLPHAGSVFVRLAAPVPYAELLLVSPREEAPAELGTLIALLIEQARGIERSEE